MDDITITKGLAVDIILSNVRHEIACKYIESKHGAIDLHTHARLKQFLLEEATYIDIEKLLIKTL